MSTAPHCPAAPLNELDQISGQVFDQHFGLTAREHAAIALRVPDSGNDWLDAMIRTAQRNDLAKAAMQGLMGRAWTDPVTGKAPDNVFEIWAKSSHALADAMLSGAATQIAEGE